MRLGPFHSEMKHLANKNKNVVQQMSIYISGWSQCKLTLTPDVPWWDYLTHHHTRTSHINNEVNEINAFHEVNCVLTITFNEYKSSQSYDARCISLFVSYAGGIGRWGGTYCYFMQKRQSCLFFFLFFVFSYIHNRAAVPWNSFLALLWAIAMYHMSSMAK